MNPFYDIPSNSSTSLSLSQAMMMKGNYNNHENDCDGLSNDGFHNGFHNGHVNTLSRGYYHQQEHLVQDEQHSFQSAFSTTGTYYCSGSNDNCISSDRSIVGNQERQSFLAQQFLRMQARSRYAASPVTATTTATPTAKTASRSSTPTRTTPSSPARPSLQQASVMLHDLMNSRQGSPASNFDYEEAQEYTGAPRALPHLREPGEFDVICARGSAAANHSGNLRFREIIRRKLPQYNSSTTKLEKSLIVSNIVDAVRDFSPDGGFIKQDSKGNWYDVGDALAREKIGQCIRDALHSKYKSSTKAKKQRRKQLEKTRGPKAPPAPKKQRKNSFVAPLSRNETLEAPVTADQLFSVDRDECITSQTAVSADQLFSNDSLPPLTNEAHCHHDPEEDESQALLSMSLLPMDDTEYIGAAPAAAPCVTGIVVNGREDRADEGWMSPDLVPL